MAKQGREELLRFILVGTAGFVVDAGVMWLLTAMSGLSPLLTRAVSFPIAFALTWILNRYWTFAQGRARALKTQFPLYLGVQLSGLAVNYGLFAVLILSGGFWRDYPVLALAAGSLVALLATFTLSKFVAFASPRRREP